MYQELVEKTDTFTGENRAKTNKTVKTRVINMNDGYEARNIQTINHNVHT